jgi:hypothetical protein
MYFKQGTFNINTSIMNKKSADRPLRNHAKLHEVYQGGDMDALDCNKEKMHFRNYRIGQYCTCLLAHNAL